MKKINKILGVVLTAILLASLLVGLLAMPAAAGANKWTKFATPVYGNDGSYFMSYATVGPGPWAMAKNGTMYLSVKSERDLDPGGQKVNLLKSTDKGRTWSRVTKYPTTAKEAVDIVCSSKNADIVYVLDIDGNIHKTTDAGSTWTTLAKLTDDQPTAGEMTALAVGYIGTGSYLFASTQGGVGIGAAYASATITIPAGVTQSLDVALNIDGAAVTLAPGDSAATVASKVATAVTASGTTSTATAAAAVITFTRRATGAAGNGALTMADSTYAGGTVPAVAMAGGVTGVAQVDTVTPTAANTTLYSLGITPQGSSQVVFTYISSGAATALEISTAFIALVNANGPLAVTAAASGNNFTLTADATGAAAFTTLSGGPGVLGVATTTAGVTAVAATGTSTVPAAVTAIADSTLNIDGIAITLAYTDSTATLVAAKIATTINASGARTVDVTQSGANLTFTNRAVGTVGNRTVAMTDAAYTGGTVPTITMTGGVNGVNSEGGVWLLSESVVGSGWTDYGLAADHGDADGLNYFVYDVAVSPKFEDDQMVMAVYLDDNAGETYASYKYGGANWDSAGAVRDATFKWSNIATNALTGTNGATIALPPDFDPKIDGGKHQFFVGITSTDADEGDVYLVVANSTFDRNINGTGTARNVMGLALVGNIGDSSLIAGTDMGLTYTSTNFGDSWTMTKKRPTGANVYPIMADDFATSKEAWAAVAGGHGAVSRTTDSGVTWSQISVIDTNIETILDIEPTPDFTSSAGAMFMVAAENDYDVPVSGGPPWVAEPGESLFKYDSKTKFWERVFHESLFEPSTENSIDNVEVSPEWAKDTSVFLADQNPARGYRSTDGGGLFVRALNPPTTDPVYGWLVINRTTRLVASTAGKIFTTTDNGTSWIRRSCGSADVYNLAVDPNKTDNLLASNINGGVYLSTNGGTSWKQQPIGDTLPSAPAFIAFSPKYATDKTIYAAAPVATGGGGVYRLVVGTDDSWQQIDGQDGTWPSEQEGAADSFATEAMYNIALGSNGVLYVVDWDEDPVARCVNPTAALEPAKDAPYFELLGENSWDDQDLFEAWGLWITGPANTLWTIAWNDDTENWDKIETYSDEVTTPSQSSPTDGASAGRTTEVTLKWDSVKNATEYIVFWDIDPGFPDPEVETTTTTSVRITDIEPGRTYYWKVAVFTLEPVLSLWSKTWAFTTELGAAQWNPFVGGIPESPANGATNVPLRPSFAWNGADWAIGYEFVLAKDAAFQDVVVRKTRANAITSPVYLSEVDLAYSTTYYWRVRAIGKTSESEWATGVFTTIGRPAATPTPPPPPAPAPEPTTPVYIWVIIGIGAALVIAVIILIVRTRRVA